MTTEYWLVVLLFEEVIKMKVFYRIWYTDSGNCYTYKDYDNEKEAIKEAQRISEALIKYVGNNGNTKLEKHTIEQIDYNH